MAVQKIFRRLRRGDSVASFRFFKQRASFRDGAFSDPYETLIQARGRAVVPNIRRSCLWIAVTIF